LDRRITYYYQAICPDKLLLFGKSGTMPNINIIQATCPDKLIITG